jgi:hypothetical protein
VLRETAGNGYSNLLAKYLMHLLMCTFRAKFIKERECFLKFFTLWFYSGVGE